MKLFRKKPSYPPKSLQEIQKMLAKKLITLLEPYGFKRNSNTFCRQRGELIDIINLQGDKWNQGKEGIYYINLAVYYGHAAEIMSGNPASIFPKEYEGQLRSTLNGPDIPATWGFSPKVDNTKRADELIDAVKTHGLPYFEGIDTPLQLADYIMNKKKDDMIMIDGHVSKAIIFSLQGDKPRAQSELNVYFKKNTYLKGDDSVTKSIKRQYLCITQKLGLRLDFPELNDEKCVGFYIAIKGNQLANNERLTRNKLELFLRNLEKKDLGYQYYYGQFRKTGAYRIGFCTKDPKEVLRYVLERSDKFANPLLDIVLDEKF